MGDKPLAVEVLEMQRDGDGERKYAGLEVLEKIDGLYVEQEWEILEQLSSWYEQANRYTIYGPNGKTKLFRAKEKTNCCWRHCCGENRPFTIKVYDHTGAKDKLVLVLKRRFRFCGWAVIPCCAHRVSVHYMVDANGNTIGSTSNKTLLSSVEVPMFHGGCCVPTLNIKDRKRKTQATVKGPCCFVCDCCGADFGVRDNKGNRAGQITKLKPDSLKELGLELATEADNFKLTFQEDLSPAIKLAMLAALFQIDFSFFEDPRGICEGRCCDVYLCGWPCPCMPACCCKGKKKKKYNDKNGKGAPLVEEMER